jgi:hypothetical protein
LLTQSRARNLNLFDRNQEQHIPDLTQHRCSPALFLPAERRRALREQAASAARKNARFLAQASAHSMMHLQRWMHV